MYPEALMNEMLGVIRQVMANVVSQSLYEYALLGSIWFVTEIAAVLAGRSIYLKTVVWLMRLILLLALLATFLRYLSLLLSF